MDSMMHSFYLLTNKGTDRVYEVGREGKIDAFFPSGNLPVEKLMYELNVPGKA